MESENAVAATMQPIPESSKLPGTICEVKIKQKIGYIQPLVPLPDGATAKVQYKFKVLRGKKLQVGSLVDFVLSGESGDVPNASNVWPKTDNSAKEHGHKGDRAKSGKSDQRRPSVRHNTRGTSRFSASYRSRYSGIVCKVAEKGESKFGFIESFDKLPEDYAERNIYFNFKRVHSGLLKVEKGDTVEFILGTINKQEPSATMVKLIHTANMSSKRAEEHMQKVMNILQQLSVDKLQHGNDVVNVVSCSAVWSMIGNAPLSDEGITHLLDLLSVIETATAGMQQHYKNLLTILCKTAFMDPNKGLLKDYLSRQNNDEGSAAKVKTLLMSIMKNVPERARNVAAMAKLLIKSDKSSTEYFMYLLLRYAVRFSSDNTEDMDWNELPLIPSAKEMLTGGLESWSNLQAVKTEGPYASGEDYLDTYFRLLRADCFSALKVGVQALLRGKLDVRDMSVYHQVALAGVQFAKMEGGLLLALKVTPVREIKNWATCSNFMFGNLLCLSITGAFNDPIWATVVDRDVKWLTKSNTIFVALSDENTANTADLLISIAQASGSIVMIESPTYYRAYQPVMKSLKTIDSDNVPFYDILVNVQTAKPPPYINESTTLNARAVYKHMGMNTSAQTIINSPSMPKNTELDESQEYAVKEALKYQVATVQGPPGTGKSFLGIKLVQLIRSMNTAANSHILVLTYKNHALDEFLKDLIKLFPSDVVRVGGRSSEPEIQSHNLNNLMKKVKQAEDLFRAKQNIKNSIEIIQAKLEGCIKKIDDKICMTIGAFVKYCSPSQLETFLVECDWQQELAKKKHRRKNQEEKDITQRERMQKSIAAIDVDVKSFLMCQQKQELWEFLWKSLKEAYFIWRPPMHIVQKVSSELQVKARSLQIGTDMQTLQLEENKVDEKDVEDEMKERLAAVKLPKTNDLKENLIKFKSYQSNVQTPKLVCPTKTLLEKLPALSLQTSKNLWELNLIERAQLLQLMISREVDLCVDELHDLFEEYNRLVKTKREIDLQLKVKVMKSHKIMGMTITGACIHYELLQQVKPAIVLIEEAAEVLEAQVLACLGPWVEHLIMIGDHKQLRPPVETYKLAKDFHMDISLMERLINNKLPYASLLKQNRMRPEFAQMLLDIYPNLQSNLSRVMLNSQASCIPYSMFWWDHMDVEKGGRSYSNSLEATRAIKLALFFIQQGYKPEQITILAGYQGQVAVLRQKVREAESEWEVLFTPYRTQNKNPVKQETGGSTNKDNPEEEIIESKIKVHTIDLYQGDENDIVIVSLVRSNESGQTGFLKTLNRRCVAQSRARCGLYFIGNKDTIGKAPHWKKIIHTLSEKAMCHKAITLNCPKHRGSQIHAISGDDITLGTFCKEVCTESLECSVNHSCLKPCQPPHQHERCEQIVQFQFPCSHSGERMCHEEESSLLCKQEIPMTFPACGHIGQRLCFQSEDVVKCKEPCSRSLPCNPNHICSLTCGEICDPAKCVECEKERQIEAEKRREAERLRIDQARAVVAKELEELKNSPVEDKCIKEDLAPEGNTASEYLKVEDLVMKYVQPGHDWIPSIQRIEKVTHLKLERRWLEAKVYLQDPSRAGELKFHGTSAEAVKLICEAGFIPPKKPGMFGRGIYFATDSSKSAQPIYTKGSDMLLVCDVLLGKTKTVDCAMPKMTHKKLKKMGYDSLFAMRGTKETKGVLYDEFVIYKPSQALPRYIVHYKSRKISETPVKDLELSALQSQAEVTKYEINSAAREVDLEDPLEIIYRLVESQFLRLTKKRGTDISIKSVDYYINKELVSKFNAKLQEMERKYVNLNEAKYILAFHGTKVENIDSIVNKNFQIERLGAGSGDKGWFGAGIYFSEFPDVSLTYGGSLLLCKVLPGKSYDIENINVGCSLVPGYDSHRVHHDEHGRGEELVIFHPDQILPCYVIHLQKE